MILHPQPPPQFEGFLGRPDTLFKLLFLALFAVLAIGVFRLKGKS